MATFQPVPKEPTMIRIARRSLVALSFLLVPALPAAAADLAIELSGLRVDSGHLQIALVDSAAGWDSQAAPVRATRIAAAGASRIVFEALAPGSYGVLVVHDENDNGRLDTNLLGMPVEGYGFSNNPPVMRKPTWDEGRFELGADGATLAIVLR
jgi:uncharacterized protein (DUF2141 family)